MFRDQRPPRHKGSFSLDFGRMGLRHEGKSLAWSSGGSSGLTDRKFRTTNLGSGLKVRRPRTIGQNLPIFDSFSSLFARVQILMEPSSLELAIKARVGLILGAKVEALGVALSFDLLERQIDQDGD